jgi:hypothetical protein
MTMCTSYLIASGGAIIEHFFLAIILIFGGLVVAAIFTLVSKRPALALPLGVLGCIGGGLIFFGILIMPGSRDAPVFLAVSSLPLLASIFCLIFWWVRRKEN